MRVLFIGGSGVISSACSRLAAESGIELCVFNRGLSLDRPLVCEAYRDNLFACYFNLHKVGRHVLTPQGATFTTKDEDFVSSSDLDFHPTDVIEDADGSLVIVDTGGWYKLCCPTSQLQKPDVLGAIY